MPIIKIDFPDTLTDEQRTARIEWVKVHGLNANTISLPLFIDTDANEVHFAQIVSESEDPDGSMEVTTQFPEGVSCAEVNKTRPGKWLYIEGSDLEQHQTAHLTVFRTIPLVAPHPIED
jgi:hypothetical protein